MSSILTDSLLQNKFEASAILKLMSSDKKKKGDKLNFILLDAIGSTNIVSDIKESDILQSIKLI
jgi:3-dehydroquinate synthetase